MQQIQWWLHLGRLYCCHWSRCLRPISVQVSAKGIFLGVSVGYRTPELTGQEKTQEPEVLTTLRCPWLQRYLCVCVCYLSMLPVCVTCLWDCYLWTEFVEEADAEYLSWWHHQVDVSLLDGDLCSVHVVQHLLKDVWADKVNLDHRRVVHLRTCGHMRLITGVQTFMNLQYTFFLKLL